MSYLNICQKIFKQDANQFFAVINPAAYEHWKNLDPKIWLVEGVHQFSVRAVKHFTNDQGSLYLPAQIKNMKIAEKFTAGKLNIFGSITAIGNVYGIDFKVFDEQNNSRNQIVIANGKIYIAKLEDPNNE